MFDNKYVDKGYALKFVISPVHKLKFILKTYRKENLEKKVIDFQNNEFSPVNGSTRILYYLQYRRRV